METQSVIIWLDDKFAWLESYQREVTEHGFTLKSCETLSAFRDTVLDFNRNPSAVKGIILDSLLPEPNLAPLGMPIVETRGGNDVGFLVYTEYLRNMEGDSELGYIFKETPVLLLSTLGKDVMKSEYGMTLEHDKYFKLGSKSNELGERSNDFSEWLESLKVR